ncbi:PP2C family protein-serine/threonine phosphatase [Bremerella cremea]|uniref:PP2C family protein-serine/threonine phosphatase n=1 Tax=Bremerella cremea TaxID=1031537 RepID=UPI0031E8F28B
MPQSEKHDWAGCLHVAAMSDIGMRRSNNQDHFGVALSQTWEDWQRRGHLFIVADGMGAHAAGELASEIAVEQVRHLYKKYLDKKPAMALTSAIEEANMIINRRGESNAAFHKMGTTCSCLLLLPQGAVLGHVGDSRIYRLRGDKLEQLTFDHSMAWEIKAATAGKEYSSDVYAAIPKNVITRSLGPSPEVEVDLEGAFPLEVGDTFMMCSDGASGPVTDQEIALILHSLDPPKAAQLMIDLANLRGGPDNITVIVAKVTDEKLVNDPCKNDPLIEEEDLPPPPVERQARKIPRTLLLAIFLLFAGAGLAHYLGQPLYALASALVGVMVTILSLVYKFTGELIPLPVKKRFRFGKGPYSETTCQADSNTSLNLKIMYDELCDAAESNQWTIDWESVRQLGERADSEMKKGEYYSSSKHFLMSIGSLMSQIRGQKGSKNPLEDDSRVDLT